MAILARRPSRGTSDAPSIFIPDLTARSAFRERAWNILPFALSLFIISTIFWAPFYAPWAFAIGTLIFFTYWLLRSYGVAVACAVGLRRIRRWQAVDWPARYSQWRTKHPGAPAWDWPRHMVIIPNYNESEEGLSRTIDSLAAQQNAEQLVVVMAMEARESGAEAKAARLIARYRQSFGNMFATFHPAGLPGETPGKGSNEAWAAREARIYLIERRSHDIERYTITSCDADAVFHPRHFAALNYLFLSNSDRYRTFWQPTIFNSNNIWDIPAPLRIPDGLSGINRLSNLVMPGSVKFPTSCYSVSWKMLDEIDYWDEEVIPEDWHVYLKCCYTLGDRVHVEALYLPLGNDCVLTDGYFKTLKAHYHQSVRHAWGASDIPYAWRAAVSQRSPLGVRRRLLLAGAVTKVHVMWAAQWYLVTLGILLPARFAGAFGAPLPSWWTHRYPVPGPGWHPEQVVHPSRWFAFDSTGLVEPTMWVNLVGLLVAVCLLPLLAMILIETLTRPRRPEYVSRKAAAAQYTMWPLMAVITFFFASLPAVHAQAKLARGRGLIYRVAEKGSRRVAVPQPAASVEPLPGDAVGALGGGS